MPRRPRDEYDDEDDDRPRRRRRAEDSDDEDDDRPGGRGGTPPSTAPTVVLILGGVFLASLLICGGIALYVYRSIERGAEEVRLQVQEAAERAQEQQRESVERMQAESRKSMQRMQEDQAKRKRDEETGDKAQATKLMEQFVAEVKADRPEAAYKLTTPDFQKRVPLAEFQKLAATLAGPDGGHLHMRADFWAPATGTTYTFDSFGGWVTVKVTVVRDGDRWLVDRFTATKPDRPGMPGRADPNSDKAKATKVMEQFVTELKADRPEAAYKLTDADFQKRVPLAEFKKQAAVVAGPDGRHLSMQADHWAAATGGTFTFDNFGGWLTVKVTVVKDGDTWLVDRFSASKTGGPGTPADENSDKGQATKLAERFVTELKADRPEVAYKLTSPDFQKRVPLAEFKGMARGFTGPHSHVTRVNADFRAPASGNLYVFDLMLGTGDTAKLTAVGEGGKWQIDRFSVTKRERPGGPKK